MNRSVGRRLRDAVWFLDDGIKEELLQKRKPKPSAMEKRLMDAKKAFQEEAVSGNKKDRYQNLSLLIV